LRWDTTQISKKMTMKMTIPLWVFIVGGSLLYGIIGGFFGGIFYSIDYNHNLKKHKKKSGGASTYESVGWMGRKMQVNVIDAAKSDVGPGFVPAAIFWPVTIFVVIPILLFAAMGKGIASK